MSLNYGGHDQERNMCIKNFDINIKIANKLLFKFYITFVV